MKKMVLWVSVLLGALLKVSLCAANGFIDDARVDFGARNYYYNNDYRSGPANPSKIEEWGQGFILNMESGYTTGPVGFGLDASAMLGIKLDSGGRAGDANSTRQPGIMFPQRTDHSAEDEFSTLGLTPKVKFSKTVFRYGTLQPVLPVLVNNDGRLLPMWFNGWQIDSKDLSNAELVAGRLNKVKAPGSTNLEGMRIAGGTERSEDFEYAGISYKLSDSLTSKYYYGKLKNYYAQHFLGLVHSVNVGGSAFKTDFRYFNSYGVGENTHNPRYGSSGYFDGATVGKVDNQAYSLLFTLSNNGHAFGAGYQVLKGDSDFPFINQGDGSSAYLPTSIQVLKFTRAGERSWQARYGYDFAKAGIPGLSFNAIYVSGSNIKTKIGDVKEHEIDTTLSYIFQGGALKNLEVQWRRGQLSSDFPNVRDQVENRLIFNYRVDLL